MKIDCLFICDFCKNKISAILGEEIKIGYVYGNKSVHIICPECGDMIYIEGSEIYT